MEIGGITYATIANAGGWVFAAAVLASVLWAFLSGRIVGGKLLDRSLDQQDKTLPALTGLTSTAEKMLDGMKSMAQDVEDLRRDVEELRVHSGLSVRSSQSQRRRNP